MPTLLPPPQLSRADVAARSALLPPAVAAEAQSLANDDDDDDDDDDSSSTDTTEAEERDRQAHLGDAPRPVYHAFFALLGILGLLLVAFTSSLYLFSAGFLLTRTELDGQASCTTPPQAAWVPPIPDGLSSLETDVELDQWDSYLNGHSECTLPPAFHKSIFFLIDALRWDFIAPPPSGEWTTPDPHHHSQLRLPAQLHADSIASKRPGSLLAHFVADAPTTTLQRLKGLTTGTLPTFIDAGANFGGGTISEDSWVMQLKKREQSRRGTRDAGLVFMGDDTWLSVFPDLFDRNETWPFDSFNVEDLDTVDAGVRDQLLHKLSSSPQDWSLIVAHTLGVDHVGHRFGASHPRMATKLQEMDTLIRDVVERMPEDTLFILAGDHGMDETGDHGGESELEVGAGIWIYSKVGFGGAADAEDLASLLDDKTSDEYSTASGASLFPSWLPFSPLPSPPYPASGLRSFTQIDLVPTISLLMGLPIPANNLGSIIPELFAPSSPTSDRLLRALRINARQVRTYLSRYAQKSGDLRGAEDELGAAWKDALRADACYVQASAKDKATARRAAARAYSRYLRVALSRAREVWAQFDAAKMIMGLGLLFLSLVSTAIVWIGASRGLVAGAKRSGDTETMLAIVFAHVKRAGVAGLGIGLVVGITGIVTPALRTSVGVVDAPLFGAVGAALVSFVWSQLSILSSSSGGAEGRGNKLDTVLGVIVALVHASLFGSNSFTVWEDKAVMHLLTLVLLVRFIRGFSAPTSRLSQRLPILAASVAVLLRLVALSTVCREEQGFGCTNTFYGGGAGASSSDTGGAGPKSNSPIAIVASYAVAYVTPIALARALAISKSHAGPAPFFIAWIVRPALLCGSAFWAADWAVSAPVLARTLQLDEAGLHNMRELLEWSKLLVARVDMSIVCIIATSFWLFAPLCVEMKREEVPGAQAGGLAGEAPKERVHIFGFANSFGAPTLLFLCIAFAALFLVAQPVGQLALSACLIGLVLCAELGDGERDSLLLRDRMALDAARARETAKGGDAAVAAAKPVWLPMSLQPSLLETSTVALIGFAAFFATGHQATLSSIQWRVAFVGVRTVVYPLSPILVALNAFGPLVLLPAFALPLLTLWNLAPRPRTGPASTGGGAAMPTFMKTPLALLRTVCGFLLYHALLAFSAALFAAHFRRHLMLFKVWTPRFLLAAVSLIGTQVASIVAVAAAGITAAKVQTLFGSEFA